MELLVVAGEASGDAHAADLVAALKARRPELRFFGMGGPRLRAQGVELLFDAQEISVMGLWEVLPKLWRILAVMRALAGAARARRPAAAILVDAPDFNLRLAARLKRLGVSVAYYVSPSVWAWRAGRTRTLARVTDELMCILPFEERFLRQRGVAATYVGNPVLEQVPAVAPAEDFRRALGVDAQRPWLAVLPGSRRSEVSRLLPPLVDAARRLADKRPGLGVLVPVAPGIDEAAVRAAFAPAGLEPVLVRGRAPEVVGASELTLVASGTATLEAALMRRPMVVVYRVAALTYWVGRLLVRIPFFSLVNLLAGRRVVPELLQAEMSPARIAAEADRVWSGAEREALLAGLDEVRAALGPAGASGRAAERVLALLDRQASADARPPRD